MKKFTNLHDGAGSIALRRLLGAATACFSLALLLAVGTAARAQIYVETKLTASDAARSDWFGSAVAISGNTAIVGARFADDAGGNSGSAYLFDATTGIQISKLTPVDAAEHDYFGISVGISGNTAIVGASGNNLTGSAYLFDVTTGNQLFKLTASDIFMEDHFGRSVAISGNTAIVGTRPDDDEGSPFGSAYLFDVTTGEELIKLTRPDGVEQLGFSVGISGNTAIVDAYLFDVTTGKELFKLTASDAEDHDYFGISSAISGNTAIVGAFASDEAGRDSGSAYLFDVTTGTQLFKLTASDAAEGDWFGGGVGISGGTAIVAAQGNDGAGSRSGSAYLFDVATGKELFQLTASDGATGDVFGDSVAISGNRAIVGAALDDDAGRDSGAAYLFISIPEPSSFLLAALALIGLFGFARRRRVAIP